MSHLLTRVTRLSRHLHEPSRHVSQVLSSLSFSVVDASPSSVSVPSVRGGAEGAGGRGPAGPRGQTPVSPKHPHPAGRRHAQHPPLPQHCRHSHVNEPSLHTIKSLKPRLLNSFLIFSTIHCDIQLNTLFVFCAVSSTVLHGLRPALEKPAGRPPPLRPPRLVGAQRVPIRRRTPPAVSN